MFLGFFSAVGHGGCYGGDARFVDGGALVTLLVVRVLCRDLDSCDLASSCGGARVFMVKVFTVV